MVVNGWIGFLVSLVSLNLVLNPFLVFHYYWIRFL